MAITRAPSGTNGTALSLPGGTNTKGAWTELEDSTPENVVGVQFTLPDIAATLSGAHDALIDIGIGGSGTESVLVPNILWECTANNGSGEQFMSAYLPIRIPIGSRISARYQSSVIANYDPGPRVALHLIGGSSGGYAHATTYGAQTSDTTGNQIDPGGTADTFGAWDEITASTSRDIEWITALVMGLQNGQPGNITRAFQIGTGGSGSETVLFEGGFASSFSVIVSHGVQAPRVWSFPLDTKIPAGTRIAVRGKCNSTDATDRLFDFEMIGFDTRVGGARAIPFIGTQIGGAFAA